MLARVLRGLLIALVVSSSAAAATPARLKLVVSDLASKETELARTLTEVVLNELGRDRRWEVLGASDVTAMIGLERQKALLGCADESSSCVGELAGALGTDLLVQGQLARVGETYRLDLKFLDTKNARVLARESATAQLPDELLTRTRRAARGLRRAVSERLAADYGVHAERRSSVLPVALTASGGAAAVAGAALVFSALRFNDEKTTLQYPEAERRLRSAQTQYYAGWSLVGAGVVCAGVGVAMLVSGGEDDLAFGVGPAGDGVGFALRGTF